MPYCSSCGSEIPEGQGSSCSMCYGDIAHGHDGYYQQWTEEQEKDFKAEYEESMKREYDLCDFCDNNQLDTCVYIENNDRKSCKIVNDYLKENTNE